MADTTPPETTAAGTAIAPAASSSRARWPGIESEPSVFSDLLQRIGLPTEWQIVEVFGLDEDLLAFIPPPVQALIMCYPHKGDEQYDTTASDFAAGEDSPYFMLQLPSLGNACGTIASIHAALNAEDVELQEGPLKQFLSRTLELDPRARAEQLDTDDDINKAHCDAASHGVGGAAAGAEEVDYHYVCIVRRGSKIFELDGMLQAPIVHGPTTPETFLHDAAAVLRRKYTDKNPDGLFALMALTRADE